MSFWVGFFRFHGLLAGRAGAAASPVVLLREGVVWDADRAARAVGVRPGQSATEVRTLLPAVRWRTFDSVAAAPLLARAWDRLAEVSSVVEPDPQGRPQAYAAWRADGPPVQELSSLAAAVARTLPHVDLAAGLGPSRLVAKLACPRDRGIATVPAEGAARLLADRPLRVLLEEGLLTPALHRRLEHLGLDRCGQLAALPASLLEARFGREGRRLHALALGRDLRPVRALHPPRTICVRRTAPDGLRREVWPEAAAGAAREAACGLGALEGAHRLVLAGPGGTVERVWPSPRRDGALLGRAAAELARRAARTWPGDTAGFLEVRLTDLAATPPRAVPLPGAGTGTARDRSALEDLLARLPRGVLRRGWGRADRYEVLLGILDPWVHGAPRRGTGTP